MVGLAGGAYFGVSSSSKHDEANGACDDTRRVCGPAAQAMQADAKSAAKVSTVGFIVGGAALATGLVIVLLTPSSSASSSTSRSSLSVGLNGVSLGGQF